MFDCWIFVLLIRVLFLIIPTPYDGNKVTFCIEFSMVIAYNDGKEDSFLNLRIEFLKCVNNNTNNLRHNTYHTHIHTHTLTQSSATNKPQCQL